MNNPTTNNVIADFVSNINFGIIKIQFVTSEDNDADILTKTTTEEIFKSHSEKNVMKIPN